MAKKKEVKIDEVFVELQNTRKKTSSTAILGVMVFLFAAMALVMFAKDQQEFNSLNAQLKNLTNQTTTLDAWARYFSPAAINAVNVLSDNQRNMTGRIIMLELKNGITPLELIQTNSTGNATK